MGKNTAIVLALSVGLVLSAAGAPVSAAPVPAPGKAPASQAPTPPQGQPAPAGAEVRANCHTETAEAFKKTPHAENPNACEACHGNGAAHVAAGGGKGTMRNFKAIKPAEASAVCLTCHGNKGGQKHWEGSTHDTRNVSCVSCHDRHPKGAVPKALLARPQFGLCTTCHLQKKAALMRSSHMPLREGKLTCTSCHNPHGTPYQRMLLQTSSNQNCYSVRRTVIAAGWRFTWPSSERDC